MPKVYVNDADRALARFRKWYHDQKPSRDMTDSKMAKILGVSQPAVSQKLKVKGSDQNEITLRDAILIMHKMNASDEEILTLMKVR